MGKYQNNKRELLKLKCLRYLGGKKCSRCGVDYLPPCCYDFHHARGIKEEEISQMISRGEKFSKIKIELDKCIVVCKNCHALIHSGS